MALGTMTVAKKIKGRQGPVLVARVSFLGDTSYPTNGSAFKAALLAALGVTNYDVIGVFPLDCGGYVPAYDDASGKLKVYRGDNDGVADGPLVEVANAVALNAVTFNVTVILG